MKKKLVLGFCLFLCVEAKQYSVAAGGPPPSPTDPERSFYCGKVGNPFPDEGGCTYYVALDVSRLCKQIADDTVAYLRASTKPVYEDSSIEGIESFFDDILTNETDRVEVYSHRVQTSTELIDVNKIDNDGALKKYWPGPQKAFDNYTKIQSFTYDPVGGRMLASFGLTKKDPNKMSDWTNPDEVEECPSFFSGGAQLSGIQKYMLKEFFYGPYYTAMEYIAAHYACQ